MLGSKKACEFMGRSHLNQPMMSVGGKILYQLSRILSVSSYLYMDLETKKICNLMKDINQAWRAGQTERLHDYFHPDMVIAGPDYQEVYCGKDACVESYGEFIRSSIIHKYIESGFKANIWENTAVCTYRWTMTYERKGVRSSETGTDQFVFTRNGPKWLAVWRYIQYRSLDL